VFEYSKPYETAKQLAEGRALCGIKLPAVKKMCYSGEKIEVDAFACNEPQTLTIDLPRTDLERTKLKMR
jgi:hypothetical protein